MALLESDEMKLRVLKQLAKSKELTLNALRRNIGSVNFESVKRSCEFLEKIGLVEFDAKTVGKREYYWVRLTESGRAVAKRL
jgi:DNA-binding HxlR family transcriptional regulator